MTHSGGWAVVVAAAHSGGWAVVVAAAAAAGAGRPWVQLLVLVMDQG
jgi:hypothetical protein